MELKKIKLSERIIDHLIQAILIFISVFLAFWLTNYQAKQETISATKKAKQTIIAELDANFNFLKRAGEEHRLVYMYQKDFFNNKIDTIKRYSEDQIPKINRGFEKYLLTNNSLFLANDTRINLDINQIVVINRISEQIKLAQISADQFTNRYKLINEEKNVRLKYYIFYDLLSDLWLKEERLIQDIELTLQNLK